MVISLRAVGKSGFCMTAYGNLGELSMCPAQTLSSPEPAWEWWTNHYHLSLLGPRCPPCVTANLYGLHCTLGCIIEINQISDYSQKWTMITLEYAKLLNVVTNWRSVVIKIAMISEIDCFVIDQNDLQIMRRCIILWSSPIGVRLMKLYVPLRRSRHCRTMLNYSNIHLCISF